MEHEGVDMGLVLTNIFLLHIDRLEVIGQTVSGILLGHCFERVNYDQTVPKTGVNLLLSQSAFQLQEHLGSIDDVHFDQIPLH